MGYGQRRGSCPCSRALQNESEKASPLWSVCSFPRRSRGCNRRGQFANSILQVFDRLIAKQQLIEDEYNAAPWLMSMSENGLIPHIFRAISAYCRQHRYPFIEPIEWYGIHAFAEMFSCPELLEWSNDATKGFMKTYDLHLTDDKFFHELNALRLPGLQSVLPQTHRLIHKRLNLQFRKRVKGIRHARGPTPVLEYQKRFPWLAAEWYRDLDVKDIFAIPLHEHSWKCKRCFAVYFHRCTSPYVRVHFVLPRCPACAWYTERLEVTTAPMWSKAGVSEWAKKVGGYDAVEFLAGEDRLGEGQLDQRQSDEGEAPLEESQLERSQLEESQLQEGPVAKGPVEEGPVKEGPVKEGPAEA
jgi:hypothetical protein